VNQRDACVEWLDHEDAATREDRITRLEFVNIISSTGEILIFHGAEAKVVYEEARYSYVYGQYVAVIMLSACFIERTLAAILYAAGSDEHERSQLPTLVKTAVGKGWFSEEEGDSFIQLQQRRNPLVHFRRPLSQGTLLSRMIETDKQYHELLESDAKEAIILMHALVDSTRVH
jgi:hypothetical protein